MMGTNAKCQSHIVDRLIERIITTYHCYPLHHILIAELQLLMMRSLTGVSMISYPRLAGADDLVPAAASLALEYFTDPSTALMISLSDVSSTIPAITISSKMKCTYRNDRMTYRLCDTNDWGILSLSDR
jgi:hypothetical protein